jgi:hypothetical protein
MTYSEYLALSETDRLIVDAARTEKRKLAAAADLILNADKYAAQAAAELLTAKRDAAFAATGNRDVYDLPVPSASKFGWAHDQAVYADYKRRQAVVAALLA